MRGAIHHLDAWIVVNEKGMPIEGHATREAADYAAAILTEHNRQHGHPTTFMAVPRSQCNQLQTQGGS